MLIVVLSAADAIHATDDARRTLEVAREILREARSCRADRAGPPAFSYGAIDRFNERVRCLEDAVSAADAAKRAADEALETCKDAGRRTRAADAEAERARARHHDAMASYDAADLNAQCAADEDAPRMRARAERARARYKDAYAAVRAAERAAAEAKRNEDATNAAAEAVYEAHRVAGQSAAHADAAERANWRIGF